MKNPIDYYDDDDPLGEVNSLLEIDRIRKEAWEEGYAAGYADGRSFLGVWDENI
jgi:hypothetical protein